MFKILIRTSICPIVLLLGIVIAEVVTTVSWAQDIRATVSARAAAVESKVVAWRRDIHEHPELSNREYRTSKLVARHLRKLGLKVSTGVAHTGVVGILDGGRPGSAVALRADMDALPVVEQTGLSYASKVRGEYEGKEVGVMHACGHDNHVAILMGVAEVLSGLRKQLPGTVKFIFQPAEEGAPRGERGGAGMMIQEGVLKDPDVSAIFGLHIGHQGPAGTVSYREAGFMASAQRFDITVKGRQTHGARPWAGVDPIVAAAQIINALQTIVSRQIDITRTPAVVTVGSLHAGVRNNIVPDTASLSGTIRTFDPTVRLAIHDKIKRIASNVGEALGAVVEVDISPGVPVTYNDPELTRAMLPTLQDVYGADKVRTSSRVTGAEDFAFYQQEIPGLFFFIGARPAAIAAEDAIPNHSPFFYVDETALRPAVEVLSRLAVDYLDDQ